jgi:hypothetical protein
VAGFGSLYLATAATGGGHAFALTAGAMAAVALLAVIPAASPPAPPPPEAAGPLGGRAVQDIWKVPPSGDPAPGLRPFYGTTLRFYDPALGAWRSTWIDPLNGRVRRFIGRPDGDSIVLEGLDDDPPERWAFRDITASTFRWTGEISHDDRQTWRLDEQMLLRRRPT